MRGSFDSSNRVGQLADRGGRDCAASQPCRANATLAETDEPVVVANSGKPKPEAMVANQAMIPRRQHADSGERHRPGGPADRSCGPP
jgi:hypothetical protein